MIPRAERWTIWLIAAVSCICAMALTEVRP